MSRDPADEQLPYLETFCLVAELNSFTAASRELKITQAGVSQRIHALEQSLGVSLFSRQGKIRLTEAGKRLYDYAQRILSLHRDARSEITGKSLPITGELQLAASSIPGSHLLPALLSKFRNEHPRIRVRADVSDTEKVIQQVESGEAHVGLIGKKPDSTVLEGRVFATDEMTVVVRSDHELARSRRLALRRLTQFPLVLREEGSATRWCFETALARDGMSLSDFEVVLELGGNEAVKEAVAQGLGVAILSKLSVERDRRAGVLHTLKISDAELSRELYVVWDHRRAMPPPARAFLRFLNSAQ